MTDTSRLTRHPLLRSQQRLLQLSHASGEADGVLVPLHASITIRLRGLLRTSDFLGAAAQVAASQAALGTRLVGSGTSTCCQVIAPIDDPCLNRRDLTNIPAEAREKVARTLALEAAAQSFRNDECLYRMLLIRLADDDHFFVLAMHHLIADNRSAQIVVDDILHRYDTSRPISERAGDDAWLAYLAVPSNCTMRAEEIGRWRQQLDGVSDYLRLPVDATADSRRAMRAGLRPVVITPAQSAQIGSLARSCNLEPASVLMAVFALLLSSWAEVREFVIFVPRRDPLLRHVVGSIETKLPVRLQLHHGESFSALLARLGEVAAHLTCAPDVQLDALAAELWPARTAVTEQVVFRFEDTQPAWRKQPGSLRITPFATGSPASDEALSWIIEESDIGLNSFFVYDSALLSPTSIEKYGARLQQLLALTLENPDAVIAELLQRSAAARVQPSPKSPASRNPGAQRQLERDLAVLWARALGLPHVGIDEHFFDLGGHSLMLPDLQQQITALTGLPVEIGTILQHPTVRKFSLYCETLLNARPSLTRAQARDERWRRRSNQHAEGERLPEAPQRES